MKTSWLIAFVALFFVLSLFLIPKAQGATLFDFYKENMGFLPTVAERQTDAILCGIENYRGTREQNIRLLRCLNAFEHDVLQNVDALDILGVAPVDKLSKTIREDITAGTQPASNELDVDPLVTLQNRRLRQFDIGERLFFRVGSGNNVTWGYCEGMTDNTTYYTLTACQLGLSDWGASTTVDVANIKAHSAGEPFLITNQHHWFAYYLFDVRATSTLIVSSSVEFSTNSIRIGNNTNSSTADKFVYANNGETNEPYLAYDESANQWVFSDDGLNTTAMVTGGSGVTAGQGLASTASRFRIDTAFTTGTTGLGYIGNSLAVSTTFPNGLIFNTDGLALSTSTAHSWSASTSFTGNGNNGVFIRNVTSTNATTTYLGVTGTVSSTNAIFGTVSSSNIFINSLNADSIATNSTTDANTYHYHSMSVDGGTFSFPAINTTGNVAVRHRLGVIPSAVNVWCAQQGDDAAAANYGYSNGTYVSSTNWTEQNVTYGVFNASLGRREENVSGSIVHFKDVGGGTDRNATITASSTAYFSIVVGTNVNAGTAPQCSWMAFK